MDAIKFVIHDFSHNCRKAELPGPFIIIVININILFDKLLILMQYYKLAEI